MGSLREQYEVTLWGEPLLEKGMTHCESTLVRAEHDDPHMAEWLDVGALDAHSGGQPSDGFWDNSETACVLAAEVAATAMKRMVRRRSRPTNAIPIFALVFIVSLASVGS